MDETTKRRTEWSSAHAQLWTSFKRSSSSTEPLPPESSASAIPSVKPSTPSPRADEINSKGEEEGLKRRIISLEKELQHRDEVEARTIASLAKSIGTMADDEDGIHSKGASLFKEAIRDRMAASSLDATLSDAMSELLASLGNLDNTVQKMTLLHGTKPASPTTAGDPPTTRLSWSRLLEVIGGSSLASRVSTAGASFDSACTEVASLIQNCLDEIDGSKSPKKGVRSVLSSSPATSVLGKLRMLANASTMGHVTPSDGSDHSLLDLRRIVDLLGGDADSSTASIGTRAAELAVTKSRELEECRREISTLTVILAEYERTAQRQLQAVGVGVTPTVKGVRMQLAGGKSTGDTDADAPSTASSKVASKGGEEGVEWLGKRVAHLIRMSRDAAAKHEQEVGKKISVPPRQGPRVSTNDTESKVVRRSVDDALTNVEDVLKAMIDCNSKLKEMLLRIVGVSERYFFGSSDVAPQPRVTFSDDESLSAILVRCEEVLQHDDATRRSLYDICLPIVAQLPGHDDGSSGVNKQPNAAVLCESIARTIERVKGAALAASMSPEDFGRIGEAFHTLSGELDGRWEGIVSVLACGDAQLADQLIRSDTHDPIDALMHRMSAVLLHLPRIKDWVATQKMEATSAVDEALSRLSQLLVPIHGNDIAVAPPLQSLDDLVAALHDRFNAMHVYQLRHVGRVSQAKHEHTRLEEVVAEKARRWMQLLHKAVQAAHGTVQGGGSEVEEDFAISTADLATGDTETLLDGLDKEVQATASRMHKLALAQRADKVRIENYQTSHDSWSRKWQHLSVDLVALSTAMGMTVKEHRADDPRPLLKQCIEFVSGEQYYADAALSAATTRVLRERIDELSDEKVRTESAIEQITERLLEVAKVMKRSLFVIGCDEEAVDEELENAKYDNEPLACVLSKLGRWVVRMEENINHLYDENKMIVKYFSAIHKHVSNEPTETHDTNLLDIKESLLILTQHVLDSVDRLVAAPRGDGAARDEARYRSTLLGYDDRLARVHANICRINSSLEAIGKVGYLSLQRGSSSSTPFASEPSSPTRQSVGFIDVDLTSMSNDDLLRILDKNSQHVKDAVASFGSSFKHINILVQKDMDAMQQGLCEMLGALSEIEVEKLFDVDRDKIFSMYSVMSDRGVKQKGCYFFSGDQVAPWVSAVKVLASTFPAILDKLQDRIKRLSDVYGLIEQIAISTCRYRAAQSQARGDHIRTTTSPPPIVEPPLADNANADPQDAAATEALTFDVADEDLPGIVDEIVRAAIGALSTRPGLLEDECSRLQEQLQVMQETIAVADKKISAADNAHQEALRIIENERDQAISEAATLRAQLRRKHRETEPSEPRTPLSPTVDPHCGGGPSPARQRSPPRSTAPSIPLSAVESYMRNLQRELQARHLCESPPKKRTLQPTSLNAPTASTAAAKSRSRTPQSMPGSPKRCGSSGGSHHPHFHHATYPHTLLASPKSNKRQGAHTTGHADGCDTCERRATRSTSSSRSQSAPRAVMFTIPQRRHQDDGHDAPVNRHVNLSHYHHASRGSPSKPQSQGVVAHPPSSRAACPKQQDHVVVVSPSVKHRKPERTTTAAKTRMCDPSGEHPSRPPSGPLPRASIDDVRPLANVDSEGMQRFMGAISSGRRQPND